MEAARPVPTRKVTLEEPIVRGDNAVSEIELRRPDAGALRGVDLVSVYRMDVVAISKVVPRISTPMISSAEYMAMAGPDAAAIATEISDFLLTKSQKDAAGLDA